MIKQRITFFPLMLLPLLISACTNNYVATNLDKANIVQYFSASEVTIYQEEDLPTKHQYISLVEGQDCQIKPHHAAPDRIKARTQARQQAYNKKANAVVFTDCATLDNQQLKKLAKSSDAKQCHAIVICYAKAFVVNPK